MTNLTSACTKIEENVLLAKLALHTVYAHLRSKINFGSFVESSRFTCCSSRTLSSPFISDCDSNRTGAHDPSKGHSPRLSFGVDSSRGSMLDCAIADCTEWKCHSVP